MSFYSPMKSVTFEQVSQGSHDGAKITNKLAVISHEAQKSPDRPYQFGNRPGRTALILA